MINWRYQPARDFGLTAMQRHQSIQRECGLGDHLVRLTWALAVRTLLALHNRLDIVGREHLPARTPFMLVANHASHLDTLVLSAALPLRCLERLHPIAAGDYFFSQRPAAAFATMALNALPVWRGKRTCGLQALLDLRARLQREEAIYILFPEGTRSRDGRMESFKPGLGLLVAATPVPVIPCYVHGAFAALPPRGIIPSAARVSLEIGPPLTFASVTNNRAGWEHIAAETEAAVRRLGARAMARSWRLVPPAAPFVENQVAS